MKIKIYSFILVTIMISYISFYCSSDSSTTPLTTYTCDQKCQDGNVGYGFNHTYWFLWNQNIAGTPVGNKDITVNGPLGGSVHIYGTTSLSNNNITVVHLTYDLINCKNSDDNYTLTFTGTVACDGTFSSTHTAFVFGSEHLTYTGTVGKNTNNQVNATCAVSIVHDNNNLSGSICGRTFDN